MDINENDQMSAQDKMELEIEKRRNDTENQILRVLAKLCRKPIDSLSVEEKQFMQARRDYLTEGQRQTYEKVLKENLSGKESPLEELSRSQLDDKARELGIDEPDKLPNKQSVIEAIKAAQQ